MDLHLRDVDEGLMRKLKVRSAEGGLTLRSYCLGVLLVAVDGLTAMPPRDVLKTLPEPLAPVLPTIRKRSAPKPQSDIGHGMNCTCFQCKPRKVREVEA